MNWNNNDTKYILKRFIIYILIAFAMFIIGTWKTKALTMIPLDTENKNFYWWCGTSRNSIVMGNRSVSSNCTNVSYNRYLIEWYINRQPAGTYTVDIPLDLQISTPGFDYSNYQFKPRIYVIDTNQNWKVVYGGVCNDNGGSSVHCTFTTNESFNYISTERQVAIVSSSGVGVSGSTGTGTLVHNVTDEDINNSIVDVNDSITNDNITTGDADDFNNNQAFNDSTGLESVIQLPLNMVNSLTNTCQPIQVTIPFINYTGEIPCMSTIYQSKFNTLYVIVKLIINGFFVYRLLLKVYELVHNAKQPDEDKLEVIEL